MSDVQTAVDMAARSRHYAARDAQQLMAQHLRWDHGYSLAKIQRRFGMSRAEVKRVLGED